MTPIQLMESLKKELEEVLRHLQFPDELSGKTTGINIYSFGIPQEKTAEDKKKRFPYVLLLPDEGSIEDSSSPQKVGIKLLIGIYDRGMENQGKMLVMNVINDIYERFMVTPVLEGGCYADEKIIWVVDQEEEYPYHYGAIWLVFNIPAFRRENEYA